MAIRSNTFTNQAKEALVTQHDTEPKDEPIKSQVFDLGAMDPEAAAKVAEAIERVRPLSREQKDNLLDILREDSASLEARVYEAFQKAKQAKKEEVVAQFPEPESLIAMYEGEFTDMVKAFDKQLRRFAKKAKKDGVVINDVFRHQRDNHGKIVVNVTQHHDTSERDQAIREALAPIEQAQEAARRTA